MQDFRSLLGFAHLFSKLDFRIVLARARGVNGSGCAWFRKTLQNFFCKLAPQKKGTACCAPSRQDAKC